MPVTAKFSKRFYDKLGHEVADELVDWLNAVDVAYRSEFRELFEVHFGRFDAKLEQRVAEVTSELRQEVAAMKSELGERIDSVGTEVQSLESRLNERMGTFEARLLRWAFGFWIGALTAITALIRLSA